MWKASGPLVVALLLMPTAAALVPQDVSPAGLLAVPRAIDQDNSFVPDPIEGELCGLNDPARPEDGSCAGGTYTPPTGRVDADADDVPDALEPLICASPPPASVGSCNAVNFTASREALVCFGSGPGCLPTCSDAASCIARACANAPPGTTCPPSAQCGDQATCVAFVCATAPPGVACPPSVPAECDILETGGSDPILVLDPAPCLGALGVPTVCDPTAPACDPQGAKALLATTHARAEAAASALAVCAGEVGPNTANTNSDAAAACGTLATARKNVGDVSDEVGLAKAKAEAAATAINVCVAETGDDTANTNPDAAPVCDALATARSTVDGVRSTLGDAAEIAGEVADCATSTSTPAETTPGAVACAAVEGAADIGAPSCAGSAQPFACANAPLGALVEASRPVSALLGKMADAGGVPLPPIGMSYNGSALNVTLGDAETTLVDMAWPYALSGDGANETGLVVGDMAKGQICPRAIDRGVNALDGNARDLRCGGDMDGDGTPDSQEINTLHNPLDESDDNLDPRAGGL